MKYGLYEYARLAYLDLPSNIWVGGGGCGGYGGSSVGCFVLRLGLGACWTKLKELVCKFWWLNGLQRWLMFVRSNWYCIGTLRYHLCLSARRWQFWSEKTANAKFQNPTTTPSERKVKLREKIREKYFLAKWPLRGSSGACTSLGLIGGARTLRL